MRISDWSSDVCSSDLMDNDGYQDLLIAQNYARFPGVKMLRLYHGHFMRQTAPGRFAAAEESAGLHNANFGIAPLVADFNGDGWPDVLFANLTQPARAFISNGGDASRSEEHTSELQSLMRISYAVFCLKKK